jgi:hypothetical protein
MLLVPSEEVAKFAFLALQVNLPRRLHRAFILTEVGPVMNIPNETPKDVMLFGVSGGRYFGKKNIQPYGLVGLGLGAGLDFSKETVFGGPILEQDLVTKRKFTWKYVTSFFLDTGNFIRLFLSNFKTYIFRTYSYY